MLIADQIAEPMAAMAIGADDADPARCAQCGDTTPGGVDADTARDEDGWVMGEDGELLCEHCATIDRPAHLYDRTYWG